MIRKKSKFLTFVFSTMFGAGHMYMGFMKQGVSIMSLAAMLVAVGAFLRIEVFYLALPILWFYSFFDSINKMTLPDMIFREQKDHFILFDNDRNQVISSFLKKHDYAVAVGFIALGGIILADNMLDFLVSKLDNFGFVGSIINSLRWDGPRLLFAAFIIFIGVKMIQGKKKELDREETSSCPDIKDMKKAVDTPQEIKVNVTEMSTGEEEKNENP